MRVGYACLATALWLCAFSRPVAAHEIAEQRATRMEDAFDDGALLPAPAAKTVTAVVETSMLLGLRAAAARLETDDPRRAARWSGCSRSISGPLWFRQRLRVHVWHVQLELERGETKSRVTAARARARLCAASRRPPIAACTFFESFDRESEPGASFSEVGISLGIGGFWTTTSEEGYSDRTLRVYP